MLNQIIIAGRIAGIETIQTESGNTKAEITVAVPRSYKNIDGEYETDLIKCVLWKGIADTTKELCKKGDIIGIKGRIQTKTTETEEGMVINEMNIIAEKVSLLSSRKENE